VASLGAELACARSFCFSFSMASSEEGEALDEEEEAAAVEVSPVIQEERRKVIKNKILAVGRLSRVFQLLREESERVSELKNASSSGKLPYGTLVLGAEGIKDAITNFEDARKSDIENERLPPDLVDPETYFSNPNTPIEDQPPSSPFTAKNGNSTLPLSISTAGIGPNISSGPRSPSTPSTPGGFRKGHARQSSWGTTMTSPSTRRRSIDTTMSLIKEAVDGSSNEKTPVDDIAEALSSPSRATARES